MSPYCQPLSWAGYATRMTPAPAKPIQRVCTRGSVARLAARASGMEFVDINRFLTLKPGCGTPEFFSPSCWALLYHICYPSFWLLISHLWRFHHFLKAQILQISGYNFLPGLWGIKGSWQKWQRELYLTSWEPESAPVTSLGGNKWRFFSIIFGIFFSGRMNFMFLAET